MNRTRVRRHVLRKVPSIKQARDEEWLGYEAHVRHQDRPIDWLHLLRTDGEGFTIAAIGVAFLGGILIGTTLTSLFARAARD